MNQSTLGKTRFDLFNLEVRSFSSMIEENVPKDTRFTIYYPWFSEDFFVFYPSVSIHDALFPAAGRGTFHSDGITPSSQGLVVSRKTFKARCFGDSWTSNFYNYVEKITTRRSIGTPPPLCQSIRHPRYGKRHRIPLSWRRSIRSFGKGLPRLQWY